MNKDLPVGHRDPRTEMVPCRYLQLAGEMVMAQQNLEYWDRVPVPTAPTNRIAYEELRQVAVFLPLVLVVAAYYFAGVISAGVTFLVSLAMMNMLHKSVQADIVRAGSIWALRDKGRYDFTKFMCEEFDLRPEDITIALVLKMSRDFMTWVRAAVQVNRENAAREELARRGSVGRRWSEENSVASHAAANALVAASSVETGGDADGRLYVPMTGLEVNPATGLLMTDGAVDVHGNMYGTSNVDDLWQNNNDFNRGGGSGFDNAGGYDWNGEF